MGSHYVLLRHRLNRPGAVEMMNSTFYDLADDVLIYTISFLSVPDMFLLRQVSISQVDDPGC